MMSRAEKLVFASNHMSPVYGDSSHHPQTVQQRKCSLKGKPQTTPGVSNPASTTWVTVVCVHQSGLPGSGHAACGLHMCVWAVLRV